MRDRAFEALNDFVKSDYGKLIKIVRKEFSCGLQYRCGRYIAAIYGGRYQRMSIFLLPFSTGSV